VKSTPEDHTDYRGLIEAKKKVEEIVNYVNEGQRKYESQQRILAIQESIDGVFDLIQPTRVLLREGILSVQLTFNDKPLDHQVFLFNDLLLVAKKKAVTLISSRDFYLVSKLPLGTAVIAWSDGTPDAPGKKFVVEVSADDKDVLNGGRGMYFSTTEERQTRFWFDTVSKCIEDLQNQSRWRMSVMVMKEQQSPKKDSV